MSISVDVYTEAKIDGVWTNIDFWVHYPPGRPLSDSGATQHIVPCLTGGRSVDYALRHLDVCTHIPYAELSDTLKQCIPDPGSDSVWRLKTIPAGWLYAKNLDLPEFSGYLPRQCILDYESGVTYELDDSDMITPLEYRALSQDEQAAYQYYEWTERWGERDVLRRIKGAVHERMISYDDFCRAWDREKKAFMPPQVDWPDVRLVIHSS